MTHREARRKMGSRSVRRRGTNGKNVVGAPLGKGGRVAHKYRFPRQTKRTVAIGVWKRVRAAA